MAVQSFLLAQCNAHIEHEIRATYDIKVGQEITVNYRLLFFQFISFFLKKAQNREESTFVLFIQIAIEILTAEFFQVHGVRSVAKKTLHDSRKNS